MQIKLQPRLACHNQLFAALQYAENGGYCDDFPQGMTRFARLVPVF